MRRHWNKTKGMVAYLIGLCALALTATGITGIGEHARWGWPIAICGLVLLAVVITTMVLLTRRSGRGLVHDRTRHDPLMDTITVDEDRVYLQEHQTERSRGAGRRLPYNVRWSRSR